MTRAALTAIHANKGRCTIDGPCIGGTYVRRFGLRNLESLVRRGLVENPTQTAHGWQLTAEGVKALQ
jgi:hypothetical protein